MPMNDDYGPKLGKALQAVHQMHVDVVKLILMLDKELARKKILSSITDHATFSVNGPIWMPKGMHRIYAVPQTPGRVEGITTVFLDLLGEPVTEPLLLVGQAHFDCRTDEDLKSTLRENENLWCLWTGYLQWQKEHEYGNVVRIDAPPTDDEADKKLRWVQVIAVPLYSISSVTDVMKLLQQARSHGVQG